MIQIPLPIYAAEELLLMRQGFVANYWRLVLMEADGVLRHLVFFEELGKMDESDASWRAVSAGRCIRSGWPSCRGRAHSAGR